MTDLQPVYYVIAGLILRIAIPIGLTLLLGWFLKQLDARWQEEAKEIQTTLTNRKQPGSIQPCWEYTNCDASIRDNCPVYDNPGILCWEFFKTNDTMRSSCQDCAYRQRVLSIKESLVG